MGISGGAFAGTGVEHEVRQITQEVMPDMASQISEFSPVPAGYELPESELSFGFPVTQSLSGVDEISLGVFQDESDEQGGGDEGSAPQDTPAEEEYNDGQDPTRPLWRLDLRSRFLQVDGDTDAFIQTFRVDAPVYLDEGKAGLFYTRIDAPLIYTDQVGTDNPTGDNELRFGDMLVQNIYLPPFDWVQENTFADAMALGVQWGLPTGGNDFVSTEKLALAGVFAWKNNLDEKGNSFFAPVWRYRVDIADVANGENRESINEFTLQPIVNISTRDWGWPIDFITFYETQEIKLNFADEDRKESGDVFIPFEVEVGKLIGKSVISVDFAVPIYKSDGFDAYDWFIEFRVGFFF